MLLAESEGDLQRVVNEFYGVCNGAYTLCDAACPAAKKWAELEAMRLCV